MSSREVRIIIKETFQHPELQGKASFLSQGMKGFRSYVKGSLIQYGLEEARAVVGEGEEEEGVDGGEELSPQASEEKAAVADVEDAEDEEEDSP